MPVYVTSVFFQRILDKSDSKHTRKKTAFCSFSLQRKISGSKAGRNALSAMSDCPWAEG